MLDIKPDNNLKERVLFELATLNINHFIGLWGFAVLGTAFKCWLATLLKRGSEYDLGEIEVQLATHRLFTSDIYLPKVAPVYYT